MQEGLSLNAQLKRVPVLSRVLQDQGNPFREGLGRCRLCTAERRWGRGADNDGEGFENPTGPVTVEHGSENTSPPWSRACSQARKKPTNLTRHAEKQRLTLEPGKRVGFAPRAPGRFQTLLVESRPVWENAPADRPGRLSWGLPAPRLTHNGYPRRLQLVPASRAAALKPVWQATLAVTPYGPRYAREARINAVEPYMCRPDAQTTGASQRARF